MSAIYPRYRVIALLLSLAYTIPWAFVYALRGDYGMAIIPPVCFSIIVSILVNIPASRKYHRLLFLTYAERCDGAAFADAHKKLNANKCKDPSLQAVVLSNASLAAYEQGDDKGAFLLSEEALSRIDGKKGIPPLTLAVICMNLGGHAAGLGRIDRAKEMLSRLSAIREGLKPKQPIEWSRTIEDYERRLSYDIRFYGGDFGDEVLSYFRDRAENAERRNERISYLYELGCLHLYRGAREEAIRAFDGVIAGGNTLRVVRKAREKRAEIADAE